MRNLKKILALALAFLMSLSLMVTAGATDFKDDADISQSTYRQAMEVLSGLGVFNGDQYGNFNPGQPITRAEVAAILYRIGTGDTSLDGNKTYAPYNQFSDVQLEDWYAGYVTYCANAGWIKGRNTGAFDAKSDVTGYEVLAMILRAVGYDKNNEFVGSNWQINTASIAQEKGVLVNVLNDADVNLKDSATRAVVAELLFRAMLLNKVTFSAASLSYNELDERVCDVLGLKEITGVVLANEAANLTEQTKGGAKPIAKGTSTLLVKDVKDGSGQTKIVNVGDTITVNAGSGLEDIGEMRLIYVRATNRSNYEPVVAELYPVDTNNVAENSYNAEDYMDFDVDDVADEAGLWTDDSTQYFIDYDEFTSTSRFTKDIRIRYFIDCETQTKAEQKVAENSYVNTRYYHAAVEVKTDDPATANVNEDNTAQYPGVPVGHWVYDRVITIDEYLTNVDYLNMRSIFNGADKYNNEKNELVEVATGEVYAGTASVEDKSDVMSWAKFQEEYIETVEYPYFGDIENGNYVKAVDVDDNGSIDYVLKREYYLDRVSAVLDNGAVYYESSSACEDANHETDVLGHMQKAPAASTKLTYADGVELYTGDVILRNYIDGTWYAEVVEPVIVTIKTVNWRDGYVEDTDGKKWYPSGIVNDTALDDDIFAMDELVEYKLYVDKGGYIRAYELAQGSQYGLVTEMYPNGQYNGAFVTNARWITELMTISDTAPVEYTLLNSYVNGVENVFIDDARTNPFRVTNNMVVQDVYRDYLQQAIAHLGVESVTDARDGENVSDTIAGNGQEFEYPVVAADSSDESWTNVGRYTKNDNGVSLYTASELAKRNGNQLYYAWHDDNGNGDHDNDEKINILGDENFSTSSWLKGQKVTKADVDAYNEKHSDAQINLNGLEKVYAVDYIKLDAEKSIAAGAKHYDIAPTNHTADDYGKINNYYVDSVNDTEYYLVSSNSVRTFTGYQNMPAIDAQYIRAAYAVAENTTADLNENDYWVARVIVIELTGAYTFDSVSLVYYNPYQTTSYTKGLDTLNNESDDPMLEVRPQNMVWGAQWSSLDNIGFYGLISETVDSDGIAAADRLERIGVNGQRTVENDPLTYVFKYNANHIYAGTIARKDTITGKGGYFDVYTDENESVRTTLPTNALFYRLYASNGRVYADGPHNITESTIQVGHKIIWVTDSLNQVAYIIDLDYELPRNCTSVADRLEWQEIMNEQNAGPVVTPEYRTVVFSRETAAPQARTDTPIKGTDQLTDVFSSIKIGATPDTAAMQTMSRNADGTFSATVPDASIYFFEVTTAAGWTTSSITIDSDNATVSHTTGAATGYITDLPANVQVQINILVDCDSCVYDSTTAGTAELTAYQTAAKALVDQYVAEKIAEVTDADAKAILEANVSETGSVLKTKIDAYKALITSALNKDAVDAIIKADSEGNLTLGAGSGATSEKTALDKALDPAEADSTKGQVAAVEAARAAAKADLTGVITAMDPGDDKTAAVAVYNERISEIETALTVDEIGADASADGLWKDIKTAIETAVGMANTPEIKQVDESALRNPGATGIYKDFYTGGPLAGLQKYVVLPDTIRQTPGKANEYDITVTLGMTDWYNEDSDQTFTGYQDGSASSIISHYASGATGDVRFGFVTFNLDEANIVVLVTNVQNDAAVNGTAITQQMTLNVPSNDGSDGQLPEGAYTFNVTVTFQG